jgi:hypothetical protein
MINSGLAPVFIVPDHEVVQNTMLLLVDVLTKTIRLEIMSLFIWKQVLQNTQIHSLQNQKVLD